MTTRYNTVVGCNTREAYIEHCRTKINECKKLFQSALLIQYKTNKHGARVGVACAYIDAGGKLRVGASKCNTTLHDQFNKYIGLYNAIQSSVAVGPSTPGNLEEVKARKGTTMGQAFKLVYPSSMHELVCRMITRGRNKLLNKPKTEAESTKSELQTQQ